MFEIECDRAQHAPCLDSGGRWSDQGLGTWVYFQQPGGERLVTIRQLSESGWFIEAHGAFDGRPLKPFQKIIEIRGVDLDEAKRDAELLLRQLGWPVSDAPEQVGAKHGESNENRPHGS